MDKLPVTVLLHKSTASTLMRRQKLEEKGDDNAEQWEGWHSCLRNEWEAICILQKPLQNNYTENLEIRCRRCSRMHRRQKQCRIL